MLLRLIPGRMASRLTLSLAAGSGIFCARQQAPARLSRTSGVHRAMRRAPDKKSFSGASAIGSNQWRQWLRSPILVCRVFTSMAGSGSVFGTSPPPPGRALRQLVTPRLDLVRMHVKILRQLNQSLLAPDRSYRHSIVGKTVHWTVF